MSQDAVRSPQVGGWCGVVRRRPSSASGPVPSSKSAVVALQAPLLLSVLCGVFSSSHVACPHTSAPGKLLLLLLLALALSRHLRRSGRLQRRGYSCPRQTVLPACLQAALLSGCCRAQGHIQGVARSQLLVKPAGCRHQVSARLTGIACVVVPHRRTHRHTSGASWCLKDLSQARWPRSMCARMHVLVRVLLAGSWRSAPPGFVVALGLVGRSWLMGMDQ